MPLIIQLLLSLASLGTGGLAARLGGSLLSKIPGAAALGAKTLIPAGKSGLLKMLSPSATTLGNVGQAAAFTAGGIIPFVGAESFMSARENDVGPVYSAMRTPMPFERQENSELQNVYSEQQLLALQDALDRLGIGGLI